MLASEETSIGGDGNGHILGSDETTKFLEDNLVDYINNLNIQSMMTHACNCSTQEA